MKVMTIKSFSAFCLILVIGSACSHHHKDVEHHHHETKNSKAFDGKCPYSIMKGDFHVEGKEEYKLEHGGETYYFSSKEGLDAFKGNLANNMSKAKKQWTRRKSR
jgi:YHS domain-containing protein